MRLLDPREQNFVLRCPIETVLFNLLLVFISAKMEENFTAVKSTLQRQKCLQLLFFIVFLNFLLRLNPFTAMLAAPSLGKGAKFKIIQVFLSLCTST